MVRDDVLRELKPKVGNGGQHQPFIWDRCGQNDIKRRKSIGGDNQQVIGIDLVNIPYFAAPKQG